MSVDPDLVRIWLTGWTLARRTPLPVALDDCWRVDVGWPDQKARYVYAQPSSQLARRAAAIHESFVFLKALMPVEAMAALLPSGWDTQPPRFLMTYPALDTARTALAGGYRLRQQDGMARILADDGVVVASGQVVCVEGQAIFDSIKVEAAHRRRGLGRAVMVALTDMARAKGFRHGILVATREGRDLYESLGWIVRSPYASASWSGNIQR